MAPPFPLRYVDHVDGSGKALFERVCELDLEGIVGKHKSGPYVTDRESTTWFKIRNRGYSQMLGREELFERERHREPVAVATRTSPRKRMLGAAPKMGEGLPGSACRSRPQTVSVLLHSKGVVVSDRGKGAIKASGTS